MQNVFIVAHGASTPVGRDAWSSAAAVRAGISGFSEHPFIIDTAGEPMRVASAPWLDPSLNGPERLAQLLFPAIDQALHPLESLWDRKPKVALALGLPGSRPGLPVDLDAQLRAAVVKRYGNRFAAVAVFPAGHAAGLLALEAVRYRLEQDTFDACVVAGAESYLEPETLEWLEENDQLHGAGSLNNAWGFIPGEAAGALLVAGAQGASRLELKPFARVLGVGTGMEQNRIKTETVCIGQGLTQAFCAALAALPQGTKVTDVYCDMNGEPYRGDEFGFTAVRVKEHFGSLSDFNAPATCWGDVSAATGPLCLALASIAYRKAYAKGPRALVWASSESGERAAVLIEFQPSAG